MKALLPLMTGVLVLTGVAWAGPIQQNQIAGDARWVAHLDVDRLLQTQLGGHIGREFLDKQLANHLAKLKKDMNVELDWRKIHSVTAYGWSFKGKEIAEGVLLLQSDIDVPATLDTITTKLESAGAGAQIPIQKIEEREGTIYEVKGQVYGAAAKNGMFILARTREHLLKALKVASGGAESLAGSKLIGSLGDDRDAFLLLGVAEGFSELANLPKEAQAFQQQAAGGRLTAGEKEKNVFLTVSLDTRTAEAATQIQQMLQGLIALGNMNGDQNADLQQLAKAARVEGKDKQVTLALQMPVQDVISKMDEAHGGKKHGKKQE